MRLFSLKLCALITCLFVASCADKSASPKKVSDTPVSPYLIDREKLSSVDNKYLFLQDYFNEKGEKEFKEPYHYHFSANSAVLAKQVKDQFEYGLGIRVPSFDCNMNYNECNEANGVFSCAIISTMMGCSYKNDLSHYYIFPQFFTIKFEDDSVVVTDTINSSRAYFKVFNSIEELPAFNEPPKIVN